jgi:ABC-type nitrate/sulfonate/bicarbonate transport system substrate-binding protein
VLTNTKSAAAHVYAAVLSAFALFMVHSASAGELQALRINTFPNAKALPLFAGIAKGIFASRGLDVRLSQTESSLKQREGLAAGDFEIVHAAVDNAIAMVEVGHKDIVVVSGGDSGMNEFFVQPFISSFADLRGRVIVVDAPDTAYALQAKKILAQHGLKDADYTIKPVGAGVFRLKALSENPDNAGAILNLPFTVQAEAMGLKSLGRTIDLLGPYQAAGAFARRDWAREHATILERYLAAYVEALRWVRDRSHQTEAIAILIERLNLPRPIAERTYSLLIDPGFGFTPDAKFDREGFHNVLALRAETQGQVGVGLPPIERYVDLQYYERAMAGLPPP